VRAEKGKGKANNQNAYNINWTVTKIWPPVNASFSLQELDRVVPCDFLDALRDEGRFEDSAKLGYFKGSVAYSEEEMITLYGSLDIKVMGGSHASHPAVPAVPAPPAVPAVPAPPAVPAVPAPKAASKAKAKAAPAPKVCLRCSRGTRLHTPSR
jgi:hypothetical protein